MSVYSIIEKIAQVLPELPPKQKKLAEYVAAHHKKAAFLTSTALALEAKVSESTVIRLSNALGFKGYGDFQFELQKIIENELSSLDRFEVSSFKNNETIFEAVYAMEVDFINKTHRALTQNDFDKAASLFSQKERILCVGMHGSSCLADYMGYLLTRIRSGITLLNGINDYTFEKIKNLNENDLVVFFCFPRYPKDLIKLYETIKKTRASVLSITNNLLSPVAEADATLFVPINHALYNDPYAAVMCTINALLTTISKNDPHTTEKNMEKFEEYIDNFDIYLKNGMEIEENPKL